MLEPHFRYATKDDAVAVTALIERAYRGPDAAAGWTTESHLLTGPRTTEMEIGALIGDHDSRFVLAERFDLTERRDRIMACALIQKDAEEAYFGMFAVDPGEQATGVGRTVLEKCEKAARDLWAAKAMTMVVISLRDELIAWYERRGYERTGKTEPFPFHAASGAVRGDFHLVELRKIL
jgi:N-acetylglutamate synthase-like GNAT family acetyltransferase